jgi:hypothetical protein
MHTKFWSEVLKITGDIGVGGRIILWHVDLLPGNGVERRNYTRAIAK